MRGASQANDMAPARGAERSGSPALCFVQSGLSFYEPPKCWRSRTSVRAGLALDICHLCSVARCGYQDGRKADVKPRQHRGTKA